MLFIVASATPLAVSGSVFGVPEELAETVIIFLLGWVGFMIFFLKEKSLLRQVREKLRLQREKSDITKDLSESYSYIGETNRKLDLMKGLVLSLPEAAGYFRRGETKKVYRTFERSVLMSCKSAAFLIRIIDTEQGAVEKEIRNGRVSACIAIPVEKLISSKKKISEENGCIIVRSPGMIGKYVAFLLFPKSVNRIEDPGLLEALATQALVLFFLERDGESSAGKVKEKPKAKVSVKKK
ncbi:MAG: hypothetical protein WCJ25_00100 [Candidatus Moraniibacteriota bacterium]